MELGVEVFGMLSEGIVLLLVAGIIFYCFTLVLKKKMDYDRVRIFSRELAYEIIYNDQRVCDGSIILKKGKSVRFGFSKGRKYFNDVAIADCLENIEDLDEAHVVEMERFYGTWFSVKLMGQKFHIVPAYVRSELESGHKILYVNKEKLSYNGKLFENDVVIHCKEKPEASFSVRIYDPYVKI